MIDVAQSVGQPERDRRMRSLAALFLEIRNHGRKLTLDEGQALLQAWWTEADRPQFDRPAYDQLWRILEHAPPMEKLAASAHRMLGDWHMGFRGNAARYLMNAYPQLFEELDRRYYADPDPEVRAALFGPKPTWRPQCDDCLKLVERVAESNRRGASGDLDLAPIIDPHPTLRSRGPGQPLHIHESTAALYQCEKCGSWWNLCQWWVLGYIYIDERSAGWAEEWLNPICGPTDAAGGGQQ
jgi:hypothetical protein